MSSLRLTAVAAISIAIVSLSIAPGIASNVVGDLFASASGKVLINLFGNYSIPMNLVFPAVHTAEALDVVRSTLLREGRIRDLPFLIQDGWGYSQEPRRSIQTPDEDECEVSYGATTKPPKPLGPCYLIEPLGATYENLLAMTVALPELSPATRRVDITNLPAFRTTRAPKIERFRRLILHFDPLWSPDGTRVLYTVWEPRGVRFEVVQPPSRDVMHLEPLDADIFTRPVWSGDGRFIAYASLRDEVKVFDTRTRTTRTFRPQSAPSERHVLVFFEGTVLRFAFWNGNTGYETYAYDAVRGTLQRVASEGRRQAWMDQAQDHGWALDRHASLSAVRSPNGRNVALFTFVHGQRRIDVRALP